MPKTQKSRKNQFKTQRKTQPKPVSITTRKSYWISLTSIAIILTFVYGYFLSISLERIGILLIIILSLMGLAFYIRFKPSNLTLNNRATLLFVGACVIGFGIWALIIIISNATGLGLQIENSIGGQFFVRTSQIICLIYGAFIGDLIGKNGKVIEFFSNKFRI